MKRNFNELNMATHLIRYKMSGMTQMEYCSFSRISYSRLRYWLKKTNFKGLETASDEPADRKSESMLTDTEGLLRELSGLQSTHEVTTWLRKLKHTLNPALANEQYVPVKFNGSSGL